MENHELICGLSLKYADAMCDGNPEKQFSRGGIAAAYVMGAEETLRRVTNIIRESAAIGGLSPQQAGKLLLIIETIESKAQ